MPGRFNINVALNSNRDALVLTGPNNGSPDVTVNKSDAPAEIVFQAADGIYFGTDSFHWKTDSPTPPANDFSVSLGQGAKPVQMTVTDSDVDTSETTYQYFVRAYRMADNVPVECDPQIINKP